MSSLLVVVLHREEILDDVLTTLVEHELPDSVVVESRSGVELLERDLPIFAGLRSLVPGGLYFSRLVLCLLEDDAIADAVVDAVMAVAGERRPGEAQNTVLLLPVHRAAHF